MKKLIQLGLFCGVCGIYSNLTFAATTSDENAAMISKCQAHHTAAQCKLMLQNMFNNRESELNHSPQHQQ